MSALQGLIAEFMQGLALWQVFLLVALGFNAIYFGLAGFTLLMTHRILPRAGIGRIIDGRRIDPLQIRREVRLSLVSIAVFGAYGSLTLWLDRRGFIEILWTYSLGRFCLDMVLLTLWNEVHFYFCHALLHKPWFYRRVHRLHHLSVVPTPFSTFSFHWGEALLLSSVMVLYMAVVPLSMGAIILFPVLALNHIFSSCRRHTLHHTHIKGNYGFAFPWFDEGLKTRAARFDYDAPLEAPPEAAREKRTEP